MLNSKCALSGKVTANSKKCEMQNLSVSICTHPRGRIFYQGWETVERYIAKNSSILLESLKWM